MTSQFSDTVSPPQRSIVDQASRFEVWFATALFVFLLVLRILYAFHYRIDSDEPQHLHVVWGWTQHMIPYRDYFDNHSPLFQLLCAPFFTAFSPRADIIVPMRLTMIPLFALSLFFTGRIVSILVSPRAGLWSAVFAAVMPRFFFVSTEFRPDDLWAVVWLALLFAAIAGPMSLSRAFVIGILLGTSFCVSAKTLLLLISLALGTIMILIVQLQMGKKISWVRLLQLSLAIGGGALILPIIFSLFFLLQGAFGQMVYCIVTHNVLPQSRGSVLDLGRALKWTAFVAIPIGVGLHLFSRCPEDTRRTEALWILSVTTFLYATVKTYWFIVTNEDYVVSDPLIMGILASVVVIVPHIWPRVFSSLRLVLPASITLLGLCLILKSDSPFQDRTKEKITMVATALQLTELTDYVMDSKGETIYRRRPFYYILEGLTGRRMKAGLIPDTIPERLVETETPLATVRRMPPAAAGFIRKNYIPIAFRLSVLGQILSADNEQFGFDIAVPSVYVVIAEFGLFKGTLDGKSICGSTRIEAGHHEIRRTSGSGRVALLWARAAQKGYNPFSPVEPDRWTDQD
ncbi:MAG: hypothetical protein JO066_12185 [Verrucomicrobia bacterium]|nr:hypothetical protein [Verrucomicrobiota bacterium]